MSARRWGDGNPGESFASARLPPGPHGLPRDLVRENQRRRILFASLEVFASRGFAAATVQDLIREAHVSRATFYEIFDDKEACFTALHDEVLIWLREQVADAAGRISPWAAQVRVAIERTVQLLMEDRRLAVVCAVEAPTATPQTRARHERMVEELCGALRIGRAEGPHGAKLPRLLESALVCGAIYMLGRSIVYEQGPEPATLAAELPEFILVPYLG